jgi:hypothetical protein
VSTAIFAKVASELTARNLGEVDVPPVDRIVVVSGVVATKVCCPAPVIHATFICVPIGKGAEALVGTEIVCAEALLKVRSL